MNLLCKFGKVYDQRKGVSKKSGKEYCVTDFHIMFEEEGMQNTSTQTLKVTSMQNLNVEKMRLAQSLGTQIKVRVYFDVRESMTTPGVFYNEIRAYLPKEFECETAVGPATDAPKQTALPFPES